ncbi:hypothetical protein GCM10010185_52900 [Saccharothrix coeruleofusca]|uniref:Uncharacterized protein n=1 Tax=Saccharothrix coeruleofusca TaxID=33919 RepID=A0A918EGM9_9PSEU|nr:hypothetical protein GCM10010185_52900 [Saccharothrix coeruleofusca]
MRWGFKSALAARQIAKDGARGGPLRAPRAPLVRRQVLPEGLAGAGKYCPKCAEARAKARKCGLGCVNARFVVSERATRGDETPDTPMIG